MKNIDLYQRKDFRRSKWAYTIECAFEYFVALLVTDSFIAYLLTSMGVPESTVGIISSLISLSFLFEFFSVFVVRKVNNVKRFAILFHTSSQMFFLSLYLIPLIPIFDSCRAIVSIICILVAYFGNYFVTSSIFRWGNSYVDPSKRARFAARKEIISLIGGIVMTVSFGYIMEKMCGSLGDTAWFIFAAGSILLFSLCDLTCLLLIKNQVKDEQAKQETPSMKIVFKNIFGNRAFVDVIILSSAFNFACYFTTGFLGTYKNMLYSVAFVQIINAAGSIMRVLFSVPFAKFTDKHSYADGVILGFCIAAFAFGINIFSSPSTPWLIIVYTVLYAISAAATGQNMYNIVFSYVDVRYFAEASAVKNSISGLCGFSASLIAGKLFDYIQNNGNMLFGLNVYPQQVLSLISAIIIIECALFAKFVILKRPVIGK